MRFSWTGLILAPLLVPVLFSALLSPFLGDRPVLGFLILLVPGCIVSYGATIFLFLPCLFLLSLWRPMTGVKVCLLGLVLGAAVFVPMTWMDWTSSGPDSGPPTESFLAFFVRWSADPLTALYPLAGLAGCVSYGFISDKLFQARRPPVNLACAVLEISALAFMFFSPPGHPILLVGAFLAYGFSLSGLITSLGGLFAVDIAPKRAAGAVMGFVGVFSYVGAAIQERISGILIQRGTTFANGARHYDFHRVVLFWIGTSVVSMILAASLWRAKVTD